MAKSLVFLALETRGDEKYKNYLSSAAHIIANDFIRRGCDGSV
jgi:hypothetical protein